GGAVAPPRVRRLARELGVGLDAVEGSGPGGRVTEADVRAAAEGADAAGEDGGGEPADDGGPTPRAVGTEGLRSAVTRRGEASTGDGGTGSADESGSEAETEAETETGAGAESESESGAEGETGAEPAGDATAGPAGADRDRTLAAPATRRIAEEEGVDIDAVPTDETRDGEAFVTPEQVRAYAAGRSSGGSEPGAADVTATDVPSAAGAEGAPDAGAAAPGAAGDGADGTGPSGERVPYRGVRRTIGERMERAKFTAPHVTHHDSVDATELVALREELNAAASVRLTYLPLVMKAVVSGLREFPYVNAQLDEEREEIVLRDEYNIGVATATDAGLLVPVIEDADAKGLEALATEIAERTERARERTIDRTELRGGTFTITNVGTIGGEYATPIVNHPEVAVLALGAIAERPRVVDGEVVARRTLPLSLSVDHRVVDGAVAARFTNHVKGLLETPSRLLLELD
ncbi:MAG: 2-oxo acid dehydrogenase subunit E2, partial [Haloferacaceae archaeon]